jgi:Lrp/AsnC family leucine-responsive transcriptional regulator
MDRNRRLTDHDARIVRVLQDDGRRSYADIGADVGMAGPSAHERVKKLEARGVIRGYAAVVDPAAVGLTVLAFTWVTQAPGTGTTDLTQAFAAIDAVLECHYIAGEADYLLKIRAHDMDELGEIVRRIQSLAEVFTTETDVVFSTGFEGRPLPLPRDEGPAPETGRARAT